MIEKQKIITKDWFEDLRKETIKVFLDIENNNSRSSKKNSFNFKKWKENLVTPKIVEVAQWVYCTGMSLKKLV